jgi:hypothetical protein
MSERYKCRLVGFALDDHGGHEVMIERTVTLPVFPFSGLELNGLSGNGQTQITRVVFSVQDQEIECDVLFVVRGEEEDEMLSWMKNDYGWLEVKI